MLGIWIDMIHLVPDLYIVNMHYLYWISWQCLYIYMMTFVVSWMMYALQNWMYNIKTWNSAAAEKRCSTLNLCRGRDMAILSTVAETLQFRSVSRTGTKGPPPQALWSHHVAGPLVPVHIWTGPFSPACLVPIQKPGLMAQTNRDWSPFSTSVA
jgi:hypothetical protein